MRGRRWCAALFSLGELGLRSTVPVSGTGQALRQAQAERVEVSAVEGEDGGASPHFASTLRSSVGGGRAPFCIFPIGRPLHNYGW